jgi:iron complex outermembrane receptor protein
MITNNRRAIRCGAVAAVSSLGLIPISADAQNTPVLEEIVVTAQRRETDLQSTPVAVTAYTGASLAADKIFTVTDLANDVPAFSLTAGTPLDVELNIRGITNTRLDSPTADPSVSTFIDGVYVGRTGDLNYDFYDLERIEVIRGPQGVLLGKNVVGGALSVITAKPSFESSGRVLVGYGNYDSQLVTGYVNGGLTDSIAGRFSFQTRNHDGYARDLLHDREVENLDSVQARLQLQFLPEGSDWRGRLAIEYNKDSTNGLNVVAVDGGTPTCETSYLRTNCTRPWSNLRRFLGLTDPRVNVAQSVQYAGDPYPTQQFMKRDGVSVTADIERNFGDFAFNSLTGYRNGGGAQLYDQTGGGPEALGHSVARWQQYTAFVAATRPAGNGSNGLFLFAEPVAEDAEVKQFSQEFRLTSSNPDSAVDWIAGAYYKRDDIQKVDHFIGETFLGGPLATLSGESLWQNDGNIENLAAFGQVGYRVSDQVHVSVGIRYTDDKKDGRVSGLAIATGDRFNPADTAALTPLARTFAAGTGYNTPYKESWSKTTPQATIEFTPSEDLFVYATVARGFKGGGFDDTPANPAQATTPYDPETVTNYEAGFKATLLDQRLRLNASAFYMDYKDLQVTQTNAACLCNLTDNAASAEIKGIEVESEAIVADGLRIFASGSHVKSEYKNFLESAINPTTGQRLNSSGNRLQRTPETQISVGFDFTTGSGRWQDAITLHADYSYQSNLFWATDNVAREPGYGLLDLRVGLSPEDAQWSFSIYGKNVTNKLYRVNIIPFFGEEVSQFGQPRTYGADLTYKF